jgi:hypothetical protein
LRHYHHDIRCGKELKTQDFEPLELPMGQLSVKSEETDTQAVSGFSPVKMTTSSSQESKTGGKDSDKHGA